MSTLHDLRATLERHADDLHDTERHERAMAVRRRVRVVRRRRAAAAAIAATVAVAGGVPLLGSLERPHRPDPAAPTVVGVAVPEEIAINGFPYELSGTDALEGGDARLRLDGSEEPRAVSLVATGLGSGSATLLVDGAAAARVLDGDRVSLPVPLPADDGTPAPRLRVVLHDAPADARAGLAVYDATGELAPGVDDGTVVFRDTVGGARLLAAAFAEDGDGTAAISFEAPPGGATITGSCRTDEAGLWFRVEQEDGGRIEARCGGGADPDAFGSAFTSRQPAGSDQVVRASVTRGRGGPVVDGADVQLGVAAYRSGDRVRLGGTGVDTVVEHAGRTWRLDTQLSRSDATTSPALRLVADTDLLLGFVAEGRQVSATWRGELTSGETPYASTGAAPGTMVDGLLLRGDTYDVRLVSEGDLESGALLVYRPE